MSDATTERVLVVPTELFHRIGHFQGFCGEVDDYLHTLFLPEHAGYRPRADVEVDPGFKQLIPYVVFRHTDAAGRASVFEYTRGTGQGEGRLHRKRSVGIGGHISACDTAGGSAYEEGMRRELEEEVEISTPYTARCVGLINDDETEVGRVHLGVVHLFDVQRPEVRSREPDILEAGFRPIDEVMSDLAGFETWSTICLEALFGRGEAPPPVNKPDDLRKEPTL